jgi:hypothetical protein
VCTLFLESQFISPLVDRERSQNTEDNYYELPKQKGELAANFKIIFVHFLILG